MAAAGPHRAARHEHHGPISPAAGEMTATVPAQTHTNHRIRAESTRGALG